AARKRNMGRRKNSCTSEFFLRPIFLFLLTILHRIQSLRAKFFQKLPGLLRIELRIFGFDAKEEPVLRRAIEARFVKQRGLRLGKPIQSKHPEESEQSS